jgi:membrane protein YqaA with SNARE-associated domain
VTPLLDIRAWLAVLIVSVLGTAATLTYYYLGKEGVHAVMKRVPQITEERWDRAQRLYGKVGSKLLFLSSVPMVGALLETAAGALGTGLIVYLVWVLVARVVRNWILLLVFDQTLRLFSGH